MNCLTSMSLIFIIFTSGILITLLKTKNIWGLTEGIYVKHVLQDLVQAVIQQMAVIIITVSFLP